MIKFLINWYIIIIRNYFIILLFFAIKLYW